ncbi:recombinase family protein [Dokdonia sp. Asnod1-B02]|uniref:recombinase family protein n=1 Tax=Dokdonia sp. Asnod1-B02 TaxID=3160573 RepID=UPI003862DB62
MSTLAIFTRLSKDDEDSNSIDNQLREGKQFAKANGFEKTIHYNEGEGVSGSLDIDLRTELNTLIKDIISGDITSVWFRDQNRLARNNHTYTSFVRIIKRYNTDVYYGEKLIDLTNPSESLMGGVKSLFDAHKNELQSYQTKRALADNAKDGKFNGVANYGYYKKDGRYVIDDDEAEVVRRIFKMSLDGKGTTSIAKTLNEEGIKTRYNKLDSKETVKRGSEILNRKDFIWRQATILNIIKTTTYKGQKLFRGNYYAVPAIVNEKLWDDTNKNLKNNRNNSGKKVVHQYILKSIIFCAKCGKPLNGKMTKAKDKPVKHQYYKCASARNKGESCGNRAIRLENIETFIIKHLRNSKDLENHLLESIAESDTLKLLNNQLNELIEQRPQVEKDNNYLYRLIRNPDLENDDKLINDYNSSKNRLKAIDNRISDLKSKIEVEENTNRIEELKESLSTIKIQNNFQIVKKAVQDIIDRIEVAFIQVSEQRRKGSYYITINYKGFKTASTWYANRDSNHFIQSSYYRTEATNKEELQEDINLTIELSGVDPTSFEMVEKYGEFKGLESSSTGHEAIEIKEDDIIEFS